MTAQQYKLKTVDRAFDVLRIVIDASEPLSLSQIAARADINTSSAFRFLKTLEGSGHVVCDAAKRYSALRGGGGEIGLVRGIELLDLIAASPDGARSAVVLADSLGLDVPQVERALVKLCNRAMVKRDAADGLWRLSTGMMRFFRPLLNDQFLARFIRPWMQDLAAEYGETVSWFVAFDWEQVVVEVVPSPHPLRYVLDIGARQPIYLGAGGKAHLAALDLASVNAFIAGLKPVQLTCFQLDKAALAAELQVIRSRGYAVSSSERVEGATSAAVAVSAPGGRPVGVVSVMMPASRKAPEDVHAIGRALKTRAAAIFETGAAEP